MLFNSYEFIFAFLPLTLAGFFLLGRASRRAALSWTILTSLFFYAWWRPINVLIIAPSILVNYVLARALQRLASAGRPAAARTVLLLGIAFNVAFLGYFKYANFAVGVVNDISGGDFVLARIVLPLGISFITFQKIAFLIDVHAGRVEAFTLQDYCLFVLFFPQLIAGPIVHYREMMPQFHKATCRPDGENLAVGATLFIFGLFKKVYLADGIAPLVSGIYGHAAAGEAVTLLPAWMAAVGFTLQIYFDFSGYTDMALGIARCFGIRFPLNFNSPLKATSIIDFWLRWHVTLTRFLTAYLYNPLALALTRRRLARGRPSLGPRSATPGAFVELLMFPTVVTMLVSGFWHGAGYLFILWGLVHGILISINHAWRFAAPHFWRDKASYARVMGPVGFVLTFVAVVAAMVLFRSPTVGAAGRLLGGMLGLHGIALPAEYLARVGPLQALVHQADPTAALGGFNDFTLLAAKIVMQLGIAFVLPNTLQILSSYQPALDARPELTGLWARLRMLLWRPSPTWALLMMAIAALGALRLGGQSEFLYWQF